jgi:hypothetical protein
VDMMSSSRSHVVGLGEPSLPIFLVARVLTVMGVDDNTMGMSICKKLIQLLTSLFLMT